MSRAIFQPARVSQCLTDYPIGQELRRTDQGAIYLSGDHQLIRVGLGTVDFQRETQLHQHLADLGIAPRIDIVKVCQIKSLGKTYPLGVVVMDKWDTDYQSYIDQHPEHAAAARPLVDQLIERFHQLGYIHGDLHGQNVVLKLDEAGVPIKAALIDFDRASLLADADLDDHYDFLELEDRSPTGLLAHERVMYRI